MTEADRIFSRFAPVIQEYIYTHDWETIRDVQLDAAKVLFETEDSLLLSSSTASGKTEAAFFPIISELLSHPETAAGISVIYIAPLKSLINDQFYRLDDLLKETGIRVTHWHGDVSASQKTALLKNPSGILQITPESLESMLMNRSNDIPRLFSTLRYIVIDEIHALIGSDRGNQVLCLLARIAKLTNSDPRRIGLSATLGDVSLAAAWLGAGSSRKVSAPLPKKTPLHWKLGMEHFYIEDPHEVQNNTASSRTEASSDRGGYAKLDPGYEYLYDAVCKTKSLVFSNSREETEYVTATLRQIAKHRGEPDVFLIHHGNLSASLREDAEMAMKDESVLRAVTCATVTMELGIDIGKLERVAHVGAPTSVSSFLQRLGRSGRRGNPPEMVMLFREEIPLPNAPLPEIIPWEMIRGIALVDLYAGERFIEPPRIRKMPLSLAFHQTLSTLAASGELMPKELAARVLSLPPLSSIAKEDYRALLISMIQSSYLELTEEGGLIVGLSGERLINNFKFYAVFNDSEDFTVRSDSEEIGTITTPPPVGDRFALAGRVWEATEVDIARKLIFVKPVDGKMEISWPGDSGEIHTRVLEGMYAVLLGEKDYPFLGENAKARLETARRVAKNAKMDEGRLVFLGGRSYCLFPWLGTRSFRTLRRFLRKYAGELGIADVQSEGCCYITFKGQPDTGRTLLSQMASILERDGLNTESLVGDGECPVFDKFDAYIPPELLRKAYAKDRLCADEILDRFM